MEHFTSILVVTASLSLLAATTESQMLYVTPISPSNSNCHQPCNLLDYYAMNPSLLSNKENVSLIFHDGLHMLNHTLEISRTIHVQLTVLHPSSKVIVQCNEDIWLSSIAYLKIVNLSIHGNTEFRNGRIWPEKTMIHTGNSAQLQYLSLHGLALTFAASNSNLHYCTVVNSSINICSERLPNIGSSLTLYKSNATDTRIGRRSTRCKDIKLTIIGCIIGRSDDYHTVTMSNEQSAIIFDVNSGTRLIVRVIETIIIEGYIELVGNDDSSIISLFVHSSEIKHNAIIKSCLTFKLGYEARNNHIHLQIIDSKILGSKQYGLSVETDMTFGNTIGILLSNVIMKNHTNFGAIKLSSNQLYLMHDSESEWSSESETVMNIQINDCMFIYNNLAIGIELESNVTLQLEMHVNQSIFKNNKNAIDFKRKSFHILTSQTTSTRHLSVTLRNVTLKNNHPQFFQSGVIRIIYVDMLNIHDCKIINNKGTSIESHFSAITLTGENLFSNNTSIRGGAIVLYESYLYFTMFSKTLFYNNSASEVGGAIYVNQLPYFKKDRSDQPPCFYQVHSNKDSTNLYIGFKGNLAASGGNDIYGGALHGFCRSLKISESIHFSKFHFESTSLSSVASDPKRVCLCNNLGVPQCAQKEYIYQNTSSYYPGEKFAIPAVVVGNDFGTVPGIVHSKLTWISNTNGVSVEYLQVQEIKNTERCSSLIFSIQSQMTNTNHELQLFVKENTQQDELLPNYILIYSRHMLIRNSLLLQNVHINFTLLDCPTGFNLTPTPPYVCNCHPKLLENDVRVCVISNHTGWIYRRGTIWVSDSSTEYTTNSFIVHQHCPYHYCKPENISVDLKNPDIQCAFNHSGVLCGGCQVNLSLALGSSRCLPCNNDYLSLLVPFIFAGIALVVFIKILDITVAKGTINGLIFYANVVWANKTILFPTIDALHPVQHFFYTFIAWLNLDLGIETCFIDGLDAYWKTWLQFVFPLYVWSIIGIVIITSHYSTLASKLFGNNSVPVLATLILLSYTKLLQTIIISLGFSILNYDDGMKIVWSFDGNVSYFNTAHTILFLAALAALFFLWFPYTIVLFTLQWLRQKSHLTPLQWINRWKPFFDAYFGKIKPKHQYWVGLLLLLRVFLLVFYAATSTVAPRINILAIVGVGFFLFVYMQLIQTGYIYTSIPLSLLEESFIVNLTILGIIKLYLPPNDPAHTALIYTSLGIVFIEFLIIVIYHIWNRISSIYLTHKR